jgi:dihydroflavonol-4-reductase
MSEKTAVVTGASGHIGFHVARLLLEMGFGTRLPVRSRNENVEELEALGARVHKMDLRNRNQLRALLAGADVLFHLAAENTTDTSRIDEVVENTAGLAKIVLSAAVETPVPVVIYTSSVVVLGRSPDPKRLLSENDRTGFFESAYVRGKVEADRFCETLLEQGADIRRIYPSWVVGPNDPRGTPPHQTIRKCLRHGQRFWFNGGISVTSVEQVAFGHVQAWLRGRRGGQYVLGGTNVTFREFFTLVAEAAGRKPPALFLPKAAVVAAATGLKVILKTVGKKSPIDPAYARALINAYSWYDSSRAVRELGYQIPGARELLAMAVRLERMRLAGTYSLGRLRNPSGEGLPSSSGPEPPLLITGAPGWLGNRMIDILINGVGPLPPTRRQVRLLVERRQADLLRLPTQFRIFPGDLRDGAVIRAALEGVGTVMHLAGAIYPPRIATLYEVNTIGTRHLIDACIAAGVRRFLYMSTDSVCGHGTATDRLFDENTPPRPYRHYGASKYFAEKYLFEKTAAGEIDGTVFRGFWFFGPYAPERQNKFLRMMKRRRQIVFGNGKNYRSISHVDNTVVAFLRAENVRETIGRCYWIGDAKCDYTVDDIYRILCDANGVKYRPIYIPGPFCGLMRGLDSLLGWMGRLDPTVHGIGKFDLDIAGSIAAAQRDFGYEPVTSLAEYARTFSQRNEVLGV